MSLIARAPRTLLRQQALRSPLAPPSRQMSGDYHHLPFKWPGAQKGRFALKLGAFLITGFTLPFAAVSFQLKKAGAGAA